MQSILMFISNLGLFQEVSPGASTEPAWRCSLTPGLAANTQPAVELGEGIHPPRQPNRLGGGGLCLWDFL